jgi:hypothetical protein
MRPVMVEKKNAYTGDLDTPSIRLISLELARYCTRQYQNIGMMGNNINRDRGATVDTTARAESTAHTHEKKSRDVTGSNSSIVD